MRGHVNASFKEIILTYLAQQFKEILHKFKLKYHCGLMCDNDKVR